jgi:hypothetical protein
MIALRVGETTICSRTFFTRRSYGTPRNCRRPLQRLPSGESMAPITRQLAEVHDGINGNSVSLRFPPIIERVRKSPEQIAANLRLVDYRPGLGRCEHRMNGGFDLRDKGRGYQRRCVINVIACGSEILVRSLCMKAITRHTLARWQMPRQQASYARQSLIAWNELCLSRLNLRNASPHFR